MACALSSATLLAAGAIGAPLAAQAERTVVDQSVLVAVQRLEREGLYTRAPDGTFGGRGDFRRETLVRGVRHMLGMCEYYWQIGAPWRAHRTADGSLRRLVRECAPELRALGAADGDTRATLVRFDRLWLDPRPRGVVDPLGFPVEAWPLNASHLAEGKAHADAAWQRGERLLYSPAPHPPIAGAAPSDVYAVLPLSRSPRGASNPAFAVGHNRRTWELLRDSPPDNAPGERGLQRVIPPKGTRYGGGPADVTVLSGRIASPDGRYSIGPALFPAPVPSTAPVLRVEGPLGTYHLTPLELPVAVKKVRWDRSGSSTIQLSGPPTLDQKGPRRLTVTVDLRDGGVVASRGGQLK